MRGNAKLTIAARAVAREVGDEVVILDLETGTYYGLDRVGARIWSLLSAGRTLDEVRQAILAEYEVERSRLESDIDRLLVQLVESQLADATGPPT
jgi:Coenzyme PQQ synthesis protein D (PqqD)